MDLSDQFEAGLSEIHNDLRVGVRRGCERPVRGLRGRRDAGRYDRICSKPLSSPIGDTLVSLLRRPTAAECIDRFFYDLLADKDRSRRLDFMARLPPRALEQVPHVQPIRPRYRSGRLSRVWIRPSMSASVV
jgi:hypothetical protein